MAWDQLGSLNGEAIPEQTQRLMEQNQRLSGKKHGWSLEAVKSSYNSSRNPTDVEAWDP